MAQVRWTPQAADDLDTDSARPLRGAAGEPDTLGPSIDSFPSRNYPRSRYSRKAEAVVIFKVVIKQGEDGFFVARCPSLRSCWSQGKSRDEALDNIREAIILYLESQSHELTQDESQEVVELSL